MIGNFALFIPVNAFSGGSGLLFGRFYLLLVIALVAHYMWERA